MTDKPNKPSILLIGAGRFGKEHLRILKELEKEEKISLTGVVVATEESKKRIKEQFGIEAHTKLEEEILKTINGVDIVTPISTHYEMAKKCLQHTNVFVEKPLATDSKNIEDLIKTAKDNNKILMVGHIYRFNNAIDKLKEIIEKDKANLYSIEMKFTGGTPLKDCSIAHEFMHTFDILNNLFSTVPKSVYCNTIDSAGNKKTFNEYAYLLLNYDNTSTNVKLSWEGAKERSLYLRFKDYKISCNLINQTIEINCKDRTKDQTKNTINCYKEEPLKLELERFVEVLNGNNLFYPNGNHALEVQKIIELAKIYAKK